MRTSRRVMCDVCLAWPFPLYDTYMEVVRAYVNVDSNLLSLLSLLLYRICIRWFLELCVLTIFLTSRYSYFSYWGRRTNKCRRCTSSITDACQWASGWEWNSPPVRMLSPYTSAFVIVNVVKRHLRDAETHVVRIILWRPSARCNI